MGRYYSGDIEGKFWFGVQSSGDSENFGGTHTYVDSDGDPVDEDKLDEACEIYCHFDSEDLVTIQEGIENCMDELGEFYEKIEKFFEEHDSYNDEMLANHLEVNTGKVKTLLENYARLILGLKIEECVKEDGECNFECELY